MNFPLASRDPRVDVAALAGLGFGLYLFYRGFLILKLRRLVMGTATSKTRSVAMGTVELCGFAAPYRPLKDPIFGNACAYFDVRVSEQRGSGRNERWVEVYRKTSETIPFYLTDDTGRVAVYPQGADPRFEYKVDVRINPVNRLFWEPEDAVGRFAASLGGMLSTRQVRARILYEHEPLYVLGYAVPVEEPFTLREKVAMSVVEVARRLKADADWMRRIDKNRDGVVDEREWDEGLREYRAHLEEIAAAVEGAQAAPESVADPARRVIIRKTPDGLLLLADKSEKDLLWDLAKSSAVQTFAGPVLSLASAAVLAARWGLAR